MTDDPASLPPQQDNRAAAAPIRQPRPVYSDPCGDMIRCGDKLEIGSIIVSAAGGIEIIPRFGIDAEHKEILWAAGEMACLTGPQESWRYNPDLGWVGCVRITQPLKSLSLPLVRLHALPRAAPR